ncbi:hypothetical protein NDU88_009083 [Pleurodeles waltl]|uniref:Uncharacterized protein n=1 Tax=Pleurodeles waltl TaxID=8319 RepID=A0AAV7QRW0_PLEWA|nr:hypothetical protein NDU88_009083 [Pleurodeles waltl]
MEERLVEALDFHVQDSVKKALVKALRPFVQPIFNFGIRRFGAGSGNPTPLKVNINQPGQSSLYDPLEQSINATLNDHEYEAFKSQKTTASLQTTLNTSDEPNSTISRPVTKPRPNASRFIYITAWSGSRAPKRVTVLLLPCFCGATNRFVRDRFPHQTPAPSLEGRAEAPSLRCIYGPCPR